MDGEQDPDAQSADSLGAQTTSYFTRPRRGGCSELNDAQQSLESGSVFGRQRVRLLEWAVGERFGIRRTTHHRLPQPPKVKIELKLPV